MMIIFCVLKIFYLIKGDYSIKMACNNTLRRFRMLKIYFVFMYTFSWYFFGDIFFKKRKQKTYLFTN